jgi:pyridoxine 4-dehydrogenase
LARGWLTGQVHSLDDIPLTDYRRSFPQFRPEFFNLNRKLAEAVEQIAKKTGATPAQIALAWVLVQSHVPQRPPIVPIPGCTTLARLEENMTQVSLDGKDLEEIDHILKQFPVHGSRYPPGHDKYMNL